MDQAEVARDVEQGALLPLRMPSCPAACPDRGTDRCHSARCPIWTKQREWLAARKEDRERRQIASYLLRRSFDATRKTRGWHAGAVMRRTMTGR